MKSELRIRADEIIDGVVHRKCPNCEKLLPLSEFGLRRVKAGNLVTNQSWCTPCRKPH